MEYPQFTNRTQAAEALSKLLKKYIGTDTFVFGIPRGGVVTASVLAKELSLPLGLVIVRKIGHPDNLEYAIAAVTESGQVINNDNELAQIDDQWMIIETQKQLTEAHRRRSKYWGNRQPLNIKGKTVIIADDGLATGLTMLAAIKEIKQQQARKIIVAVPISPTDTAEKIIKEVDEFVALNIPAYFEGSVGAYYKEFPQIEDTEVLKLIKEI